jgi:hypothetical protein
MKQQDRELFTSDFIWFNSFFENLKLIFEKLGKLMIDEYSTSDPGYYYPKFNTLPSLPRYYLMASSGLGFAIQVFAILDPQLIKESSSLLKEPCIAIVAHNREDRSGWPDEYGLKVLSNKDVTFESPDKGCLLGRFDAEDDVRFFAFQVPLSKFEDGVMLSEILRSEILDRLEPFIRELE